MDTLTLQMNQQYKILQSLSHLPRFETLAPRKVFYINRNTSLDLMSELIHRVKQTNQFIMATKYDYTSNCPALLQVLFWKEFNTYVILIEMRYLPNEISILFQHIELLLSIILCPSNFIQAWGDIKIELKHFLTYGLFSIEQLVQIEVVNLQQKFKRWFDKIFDHNEDCYELYDDMNDNSKCICLHRPFQHTYNEWSLKMAIGFTFHTYFDTSLTYKNWSIGLFLQFHIPSTEETNNDIFSDAQIQNENIFRCILSEYVTQECMATYKIGSLLQNAWIRKHTEEYLKNYYNN